MSCTYEQLTGDLSQVDLPRGVHSGLRDAFEILREVEGVQFINFNETDVIRHPLVGRIVNAYGKMDRRRHTGARYQGPEADYDANSDNE